jgi:hypothetical protein
MYRHRLTFCLASFHAHAFDATNMVFAAIESAASRTGPTLIDTPIEVHFN